MYVCVHSDKSQVLSQHLHKEPGDKADQAASQPGSFLIIPPTFEIAVLGVVAMEVTESQQDLMEDVADVRLDQLLPSLGIILNQLIKSVTLHMQSAKDLPQVG